MPEQTVLVLGCGVAGVAAARELRRLLPGERVVVIDRAERASLPSSYTSLATGEVRAGAIQRSRSRLARRGIEFVNANVQHIDLTNRHVRAEGREFRFDYLVVALGAELAPELIPGLAETAQTFYSFEGGERLGAALRYFAGGRVVIAVGPDPVRWPAAPYEMAMLMEHWFHRKRMRQKVEISVLTPETAPLRVLGPDVSDLIAGQLAHKGIEFAGGAEMARVDQTARTLETVGGETRPFDLLAAVPPHVLPAVAAEAGLADESGWITVDSTTLQTSAENVFAIGDCARVITPAGRAMMSGILGRNQARLVARQIASRIVGGRAPGGLSGNGRAFIEVGAGAAVMISGDFLNPATRLRLAQPSIVWHWARAALERQWLLRW